MDKEKKKRFLWAKLAGAKLICQECGRNSIDDPELRFIASYITENGDWTKEGELVIHCQSCGWAHPRIGKPETWTWVKGSESENTKINKESKTNETKKNVTHQRKLTNISPIS